MNNENRTNGKLRWWIAKQTMRARKTIMVEAHSRKEAQEILDAGGGEGVDMNYYDLGPRKVVREDKP